MDEHLESAHALIAKDRLIQQGDAVLAAVSGGGDSVGLLLFLFENREALGISTLAAAHVNHRLRAQAQEEEAFVRALCEKLQIPLLVKRLSPENSDMPEEWAREQRYAFLQSAAEQSGAKIAVAHTQDDQAETVLFHILRGTFVHGAAGMKSMNGAVIRPFLHTARDDVRRWLSVRGQTWCEDATNATLQYTRGRIRNETLPLLEKVHPGAQKALLRFSQGMRELSDWLEELAQNLLMQARCEYGGYDAACFASAPAPVAREAVRLLILQSGAKPEKTALCRTICSLFETGGALAVSQDCIFRVSQGRLFVEKKRMIPDAADWKRPFSAGVTESPDGRILKITVMPMKKANFSAKDRKKALKFWADYDMISVNTQFRTKQPGDTFCPAERNMTKPLKKWYSEAKIPLPERERIPVLARGNEILWVPGWGVSRSAAVSSATKTIVEFQVLEAQETPFLKEM